MNEFENKGYTNPTMMTAALRSLGVAFRRKYEFSGTPPDGQPRQDQWPEFGLVRIQWSGPWTKPGVPLRARYRHTHWIGHQVRDGQRLVFDINAICVGGWVKYDEWTAAIVPWLLKECGCHKWDGTWWPTHCWEVDPAPEGYVWCEER